MAIGKKSEANSQSGSLNRQLVAVAMLVIAIPLAGEYKFYPFQNDYRVSLAPPLLFFFLLWYRRTPPVIAGITAGGAVVFFRVCLELVFGGGRNAAFWHHYPAFFFYFTYAALFQLARINRIHHRLLLVGFMGVGVDLAASVTELLFRNSLAGSGLTLDGWNEVLLISIFRSFFVLGFFNLIKLREAKLTERQQRKQVEHLLVLTSNLYVEAVQLQKTMMHAETVTRDCYLLYQGCRDKTLDDGGTAAAALRIAGQMHEIKKDNQRVYAGLSQIISGENATDYMRAEELGELVVRTNRKYARLLGKRIEFRLRVEGAHPAYHVYTMLSLLNNLAANAIEAIPEAGEIDISLLAQDETVILQVTDNGPGVPERLREVIFKPGFTTKYDASGNPSTGIGLPYVKQTAESLHGSVRVESRMQGTGSSFVLTIPTAQIANKE